MIKEIFVVCSVQDYFIPGNDNEPGEGITASKPLAAFVRPADAQIYRRDRPGWEVQKLTLCEDEADLNDWQTATKRAYALAKLTSEERRLLGL